MANAPVPGKRVKASALRMIDFGKQRRDAELKETLAVLRALLARAERGDLIGIACCFREPGGSDRCVSTGPYKANPALGVNAAFRMGLLFTQLQDEMT
jgi:hypothetical protein